MQNVTLTGEKMTKVMLVNRAKEGLADEQKEWTENKFERGSAAKRGEKSSKDERRRKADVQSMVTWESESE